MKTRFVLTLAFLLLNSGAARKLQSPSTRAPGNEQRYSHSTETYKTINPRIVLQSLLLTQPPVTPARTAARQANALSMPNLLSPGDTLLGNRQAERRRVIGSVTKGVLAAATGSLLGTDKVMAEEVKVMTDEEAWEAQAAGLKQSLEETQAKIDEMDLSLSVLKKQEKAAGRSKAEAESNAKKMGEKADSLKSDMSKLEPLLQDGVVAKVTVEKLLEEVRAKTASVKKLQQEAETATPEDVSRLSAMLDSEMASLGSLPGVKAKVAELENSQKEAMTDAPAEKILQMRAGATVESLESEGARLDKSLTDAKTKLAEFEESITKLKGEQLAAEASMQEANSKAQDEAAMVASLQTKVAELENLLQEEDAKATSIESQIAELQKKIDSYDNDWVSIVAASGLVLVPLIGRALGFQQADDRRNIESNQPTKQQPSNAPVNRPMPASQPAQQPVNQVTNPIDGGAPQQGTIEYPVTFGEYLEKQGSSKQGSLSYAEFLDQQSANAP